MRYELLKCLSWQDVKEIVDTADEMGTGRDGGQMYYNEVLALIRSRNDCSVPVGERYEDLVKIAEKVVGVRLGKSKERDNTIIRMLVAHRLSKEGYGRTETGRAMGRDHASVLNLIRRMDDALSLPRVYRRENELYRLFLQSVHPNTQTTSASSLAESPAI